MLLIIGRILLAVAAISLLILVHEFGHLVCAKAVGMRVEVFSIGFWKRLFGIKIGDTDYRVSLVPLGGFVKVSGESVEEGKGKPYEFWSKTPGQRALFVVGGVVMNAVLALGLFIIAFAIGVPFEAARVGELEAGSPAWQAGIQRGDRIVRVNDLQDPVFDDLMRATALRSQSKVRLDVERDGQLLTFSVEPKYDEGIGVRLIGVLPEMEPVVTGMGKIAGSEAPSPAQEAGVELGDRILAVNGVPTATAGDVSRQLLGSPDYEVTLLVERDGKELTLRARTRQERAYMVGISTVGSTVTDIQPGGPARNAGLRVGDRISAVNGQPVHGSLDLVEGMREAHGPVALDVMRDGRRLSMSLNVPTAVAAHDFLGSLVFGSGPTLTWVNEGSPAWQAGMRVGDTLVSVAGRQVKEWADVEAASQSVGRDAREILWLHDGKALSASVTPVLDQAGKGGRMGIVMNWPVTEARKYGPVSAVMHGIADFRRNLTDVFALIQGLATRQVSPEVLGGIVAISRISYRAAEFGLGKLLHMTAMISISIAFLNILPVPILDGGHLLFLAIEKLRGRRLSDKVMNIAQTVGFVLLILLVVYVTKNDILRLLRPG